MRECLPVQCETVLYRTALLVKQARLGLAMRQLDIAERAGVSLRAIRRIEAGKAEGVTLRDFMMTLFVLGVSDQVFQALSEVSDAALYDLESNTGKRVRRPRGSPDNF